jgi:TRAP transporter TAXI family solute receptor
VYGPAWGSLVAQATALPVAYRATQGANENILLIDRGRIDLGMTTLGVARQAWEGTGYWTKGVQIRSFRALFPMYDTPFHGMAPAGSGIGAIADLAGRRVGVGPEGGTSGLYIPVILKLLRVPDVSLVFGAMADQAAMVLDGRLDACMLAAGAPVPAYTAASARADVAFFGFAPAEITGLTGLLPELSPATVARGTYRGQTQDVRTIGMFNFAIGARRLPDDLAHAIVKAVLGVPGRMRPAGPEAAETVAANASRDTFLPFHVGAARFFRECGIQLPPRLVAA